MPNKPSAKKALRQAKKRVTLNFARKHAYKQAVKNTVKAAAAGTKDEAAALARTAQKTLGKATKAGALKKKAAARKLSRLMKKVNAIAK